MTYSMDNLFGDLDEKDFGSKSEEKIAAAPKFPCMSCAGTGVYRGVRVNQPESKCFACNGKGSHKKDHWEVMKDKKARAAKSKRTREDNIEIACANFHAANPQVAGIFAAHASWNRFVANVRSEMQAGKMPNAKAIEIMMDIDRKSKERDALRQAERDALAVKLDYASIVQMFETAMTNGLKRMSYRAEGFVMTPAAKTGRNPGAIYVKRVEGGYLGKVIAGKFHAGHGVTAEDTEKLLKIAANPLEAAKAYGKLTGKCSCCGRQLTDHVSIALGIGPICAEKWGFMGSDAMPSDEAKTIRKEGRAAQRKIIRDAAIEAGAIEAPEKTALKNSPKSVAGKYDAFYTSDMTAAQKKALRAKLRKGQK